MNKNSPWSATSAHKRLAKTVETIDKNADSVKSVFTTVFPVQAAAHSAPIKSPLAGALVSVKDLFDVQGHVTRAGTRFMSDDAPAAADAPPIAQLRSAGALLVGHTNMTELAFSGLGINPHYGTPANSLRPDCIPGGSSSGGAVSVALGLADIAIGTDTGGSLRIPAAFNGIVGYKPSQAAVSRQGCKTLSYSLDSVGPMARTVHACRLAFNAMRLAVACDKPLQNPVLVVPTNFGLEDLDTTVADGFQAALERLESGGHVIEKRTVPALDVLKSMPIWHFASVESRGVYADQIDKHADRMDPRVLSRIMRSDDVNAWSYSQSLAQRERLISQYEQEEANTVLLMPTSPIVAPKLSELLDNDDLYYSTNMRVLRNPSVANILNGCSISLPFCQNSDTVGIMLTAPCQHDDDLLSLAARCEDLLIR